MSFCLSAWGRSDLGVPHLPIWQGPPPATQFIRALLRSVSRPSPAHVSGVALVVIRSDTSAALNGERPPASSMVHSALPCGPTVACLSPPCSFVQGEENACRFGGGASDGTPALGAKFSARILTLRFCL
eukprot:GGOE01022480.1.p2 GENE.GGOE01022480.1~~GGOE01022480.1.p2  ORF type:complete len:129 (-),score=3.40 GGOE01022480.1:65-451(-)